MSNDKDILDFILKHKALFWYTPVDKLSQISLSFLTETILNYGTMDDVRELLRIAGNRNVASAFRNSIQSRRHNYFPDVENYFTLFFTRYAS